MRIAVATPDDATITNHFRQSTRFAVFDAQDGRIEPAGIREYDASPESNHHQSALSLLDGCHALLCGAIADRIAVQLEAHGIEQVVVADCTLAPAEAARQYIAGTLERGMIHRCGCDH